MVTVAGYGQPEDEHMDARDSGTADVWGGAEVTAIHYVPRRRPRGEHGRIMLQEHDAEHHVLADSN